MLRFLFVNTGEEMLRTGKAKEGLELLRQNAGASTKAMLRVADGYLAVGSRAEAVRVCREVIAKEPKDGRMKFEVESLQGRHIRSDLARAVVNAGWNLNELSSVGLSLEEIFLQLTASEQNKSEGAHK